MPGGVLTVHEHVRGAVRTPAVLRQGTLTVKLRMAGTFLRRLLLLCSSGRRLLALLWLFVGAVV